MWHWLTSMVGDVNWSAAFSGVGGAAVVVLLRELWEVQKSRIARVEQGERDRQASAERSAQAKELERLRGLIEHEIEVARSAEAKAQYVHTLQFAEEFKLYQEVWKRASASMDALHQIVPPGVYDKIRRGAHDDIAANWLANGSRSLDNFQSSLGGLCAFIQHSRPFIDERVLLDGIEGLVEAGFAVTKHFDSISKDMLSGTTTVDGLSQTLDALHADLKMPFGKLCAAIRARIGFVSQR